MGLLYKSITFICSELDTIEHPSSPVSTPAAEADPLFFDKVQQDVENIVRKEIIQDEYRKVWCNSLMFYIYTVFDLLSIHALISIHPLIYSVGSIIIVND